MSVGGSQSSQMVHFDLSCLTWHSYIIRAFVEGTLRTFMGAIAAGCRKASSYRKVPKERDSGVRSSERTLDTPGKENDATIWLTKILEIIRKSVFVQCLQSIISRMWAQVEDHRFGFCFFLLGILKAKWPTTVDTTGKWSSDDRGFPHLPLINVMTHTQIWVSSCHPYSAKRLRYLVAMSTALYHQTPNHLALYPYHDSDANTSYTKQYTGVTDYYGYCIHAVLIYIILILLHIFSHLSWDPTSRA